jgi:hypothetical protein
MTLRISQVDESNQRQRIVQQNDAQTRLRGCACPEAATSHGPQPLGIAGDHLALPAAMIPSYLPRFVYTSAMRSGRQLC